MLLNGAEHFAAELLLAALTVRENTLVGRNHADSHAATNLGEFADGAIATAADLAEALHEMIWAPLGAEHEGYYWLDSQGVEMAGGGLAITLRDAARFGQMILQDGTYNGRQVVSENVAHSIKTKRNSDKFNRFYNDPWYENVADSYHDQWWGYAGVNAVAGLGIHGQFIYINSDAGVVIVKHSSDPDAESERIDSETPFVMHALAGYLADSITKSAQDGIPISGRNQPLGW